jgi:3-oxoacyl-[acyl-carrier protein] reductase
MVSHFLARGAAVATFARTPTPVVRELELRYPQRFLFAALDATDEQALGRFVAAAADRLGEPTGLVNSAASGQDSLLVHTDPATISRILETNVRAPILLTRLVLRRMLLAGYGRIVTITSVAAGRGFAGLTVYSASKGALEAFTRALAREVGERNVLVNAVAPGFFASEMSSVLSPEQMQAILRRTPTGRLAREEDILPVVDLCLFGNGNVTGQVFNVDGGASV